MLKLIYQCVRIVQKDTNRKNLKIPRLKKLYQDNGHAGHTFDLQFACQAHVGS